jgi:hypothetical protein
MEEHTKYSRISYNINDKITFRLFGFSITEQSKGYAPQVKSYFNGSSTVDFEYQAIGGATFNIIPFLFDQLNLHEADYALLEISSCVRFSKTWDGYWNNLVAISERCLGAGALPCFIQLHRRGVDYNDDLLSRVVAEFCATNGFPCLDLVGDVLKIQKSGNLSEYLRDGTHTADLGTELYAGRLIQFIDFLSRRPRSRVSFDPSVRQSPEVGFVPISELVNLEEHDIQVFQRANLRMPFLRLLNGRDLRIDLPKDCLFSGIMVLMGPKTGWLRINFHDFRQKRKRLIFDRKSYYRRYSYWFERTLPAVSLTLTQLNEKPTISLDKGEPWEGPLEANIIGAFVQKGRKDRASSVEHADIGHDMSPANSGGD